MGRGIMAGVAAAVVVAVVAGAALLWPEGEPGTEPVPGPSPTPRAAPSPSPEIPAFELRVRVGKVKGRRVDGAVPRRRLRGPAQAVRATMTELYSIGFVDPDRWDGGRFAGLIPLFVGDARRQAERDLRPLTLGPVVDRLDAVRPRRARLDVRFVLGSGRRPLVAFAEMDFAGVALSEDLAVPVRHRGRYVLRPSPGGWRITSYDVRAKLPSPAELRRKKARARGEPGLPVRRPFFVLVIGSDARPGQSVARSRADSLHIVGVNPKRGAASIVGIPRDSWVFIPGVGTRKINESTVRGGPELAVRTVRRLTGVPIDAYVLTGFRGFERMISAVGGVEVRIPYRMADRASRAYFRPGRKRLSGQQALAFSRNRYDAPGGDFGRSLNQGRVMVAALKELRRELRDDPSAVASWVLAGGRHLRTDLSLEQMVDLLMAARAIEPGRVRNVVVSGTGGSVGGQSIVRLGPGAFATFRDLRQDGVLGGRR